MTLIQAAQQTIEQFRASQVGFCPDWYLDTVTKHNKGESLVYRKSLDGAAYEYFWYTPKTGKVEFGYVVGCTDDSITSGLFMPVYEAIKASEEIVEAKWKSCWRIAKYRNTQYSTLLPIVAETFDKDGRD